MPRQKVRTGCRTCKDRKVKCDETRPTCLRCAKGHFLCKGYAIVVPAHTPRPLNNDFDINGAAGLLPVSDGLTLQRLSSMAGLQEADYSTWDFCRRYTMNELTSSNYSRFWTTTILASAQHEPATLNGLLALSVAHQARRRCERPAVSLAQQQSPELLVALKYYYSSVARLREHLHRYNGCDKITIMVTCLVLVYFDLVIGRYGESYLHLKNGRTILVQSTGRPSNELAKPVIRLHDHSSDPLSELSSEFAALDLQSVNFGSWETLFLLSDEHTSQDGLRMPEIFVSIEVAWKYLTILHNMLHHLAGVDKRPEHTHLSRKAWDTEATERQSRVIFLLHHWKLAFDSSALRPTTLKADSMGTERQKYQRCQLMYLYLQIVAVNAHHVAREMEYDRLLLQFVAIVDLCEELAPSLPKVSIETAIIQPLFLVACCCRHPSVRRRCLQILSVSRVEGHWDASLIKLVAEFKMQVEEEEARYNHSAEPQAPLDPAWVSGAIPAHSRYTDTLMFFIDADYHLLEIQLRRNRLSSSAGQEKELPEFDIRREVVPWPPLPTAS